MKPILKMTCLMIALGLLGAAGAIAQTQTTLVPPAAFDITGFIEEATLDGTVGDLAASPMPNADDRAGGTVTVNGIKMYVPNNTFVQMPASALSWKQLFDTTSATPVNSSNTLGRANLPVDGVSTGLALADSPAPFPSFEIRAVGNIRTDLPGFVGVPKYIVGGLIVPIGQEQLMAGFGVINYIYYNDDPTHPGRFEVGGTLGSPGTGAILEINDPVGRFGHAHSPDPRFSADTGNPTVAAASGYPVGIPDVARDADDSLNTAPFIGSSATNDPRRPNVNRPPNPARGATGHDPWIAVGAPLKTFTMNVDAVALGCNASEQVPLRVGDTVDYAGTLYKIDPTAPFTAANSYISVHTLTADLGIFTRPGTRPCYVAVEAFIVPTAQTRNAPPVFAGDPRTSIPLENTTRVHIVGFTTDPTRLIDLKRIQVNPTTGAETFVTFASVLPEQLGPGLVRGRFRFQPSRTTGIFPPTREYQAVSRTGTTTAANGLLAGQFRLPCFDFLFGERTVFGNPTVPVQFDTLPFLAIGSGPLTGGPAVFGRLDPWPGPNPPITNP